MQNAAFVSWVNSNDWHLMVRAPRDHQNYLWNVFRRKFNEDVEHRGEKQMVVFTKTFQ